MKYIKLFSLLIIIFISLTLSGCWNYTDVDNNFVVMGAVVTKDKETNEYTLTTEIAKSIGGTEIQIVTRIESANGKTIFEASRDAIKKVGAKLYWGHAMVFIISESIAKDGIADIMSFIREQKEIRSDIFILIAEDESADKIFEFIDPIHDNISQHIHDLLESYEASGEFRKTPSFKVLRELASTKVSLMLPILKMIEKESSKKNNSSKKDGDDSQSSETDDKEKEIEKILLVHDTAVFKGDKMVGSLDETNSKNAFILKKDITKNYIISIGETKKIPTCTIEIIKSNLKMKPIIENDELNMQIDLELTGDIVELHSIVDFITDEKVEELEIAFEELIYQELKNVTMIVQKQYCSDIFGFAGIIHRKEPSFWKENSLNWYNLYKEMQITINTSVDITSSSLSMNPVKVGE